MPTELFRTVCPGNFNFKDQRCACILNRISVWLYEKLDNVTVMSNWINVRIVHVTVWFVQETLYFFTDKEAKVNHSLCLLRVMKSFFLTLQGNVFLVSPSVRLFPYHYIDCGTSPQHCHRSPHLLESSAKKAALSNPSVSTGNLWTPLKCW